MGVLACDRKNCDNIMCDFYVQEVGYICWECYKEFKELNPDLNIEYKIIEALEVFMKTPKKEEVYRSNEQMNISEFFDKHNKCK